MQTFGDRRSIYEISVTQHTNQMRINVSQLDSIIGIHGVGHAGHGDATSDGTSAGRAALATVARIAIDAYTGRCD